MLTLSSRHLSSEELGSTTRDGFGKESEAPPEHWCWNLNDSALVATNHLSRIFDYHISASRILRVMNLAACMATGITRIFARSRAQAFPTFFPSLPASPAIFDSASLVRRFKSPTKALCYSQLDLRWLVKDEACQWPAGGRITPSRALNLDSRLARQTRLS